ncbi:MAG: phage holin family protein [Myxococcaceae bacterium]|nr:phage holin family protein [Myxococcaceae bacterium]MBR2980260.1 phage holin family protein [Myxococcaceae bacterium]
MARHDKEASVREEVCVDPVREGERSESRKAHSPRTAAQALGDLSEGLSALIRGQFMLARAEMRQEVRAVARDAAMELVGVPIALIGYLLLMFAAVAALALALPIWASFLIVAGAHLLLGLGAIAFGATRMRKKRLGLPRSTDELKKSKSLAQTIGREKPLPVESRQLH